MITTSYGDMAQFQFLRNRSVQLNSELDALTQEASTYVSRNLIDNLGGELGFVSELERSISKMKSYQVAAQESALYASTAQKYVGRISENALDLGTNILAMSSSANENTAQQMSTQSAAYLRETISSLNGQLSGRSLFSGTDTGTTPLESADTMMTALMTEVTGMTDANVIAQAVRDWFNDPAGFDAVMYNGSTNDMSAVQIGASTEVNFALRADDDAFKQAMQSFAMGALAGEDYMNLDGIEASALVSIAGTELLQAEASLTTVQSDLGFVEARIEETKTRNTASLTTMSTTLNDLILADPEETASRIDEVQYQLEALYTITVKSSQLTLLNFM